MNHDEPSICRSFSYGFPVGPSLSPKNPYAEPGDPLPSSALLVVAMGCIETPGSVVDLGT